MQTAMGTSKYGLTFWPTNHENLKKHVALSGYEMFIIK